MFLVSRLNLNLTLTCLHNRIIIALLVVSIPGCIPTISAQSAADTVTVSLDVAQVSNNVFHDELFGINTRWPDNGDGIIDYGELIQDRSFRRQGIEDNRRWLASPSKETNGKIRFQSNGGDKTPWGGTGYPGFVTLSQKVLGYTCITQKIDSTIKAGSRYELHFSGRTKKQGAGVSVFFAGVDWLPIEKLDNLTIVKSGEWDNYQFFLDPEKSLNEVLLRLCLISEGTVQLDEIRLNEVGASPSIKTIVKTRIRDMGIRSLRWPSGSNADFFDWKQSGNTLLPGSIAEHLTSWGAEFDRDGQTKISTWFEFNQNV